MHQSVWIGLQRNFKEHPLPFRPTHLHTTPSQIPLGASSQVRPFPSTILTSPSGFSSSTKSRFGKGRGFFPWWIPKPSLLFQFLSSPSFLPKRELLLILPCALTTCLLLTIHGAQVRIGKGSSSARKATESLHKLLVLLGFTLSQT